MSEERKGQEMMPEAAVQRLGGLMNSDILRVGLVLFLAVLAIAAMVRFVWWPTIAGIIYLTRREQRRITRAKMARHEDMTILQRVEWLESIIRIYGFLLAEKGLTIEQALRDTIGNPLWLNGVDDDGWQVLWNEIAPFLLHQAQKRGEQVSWGTGYEEG